VTATAEVPIVSASSPVPAGRRWVQLLRLATALCAANYARTAVSPLQEEIRVALSLSDNQMALLQGPAMALPLLLAAIPLGVLVDRYSRSRLLWIFTLFTVLGGVLTAMAGSFATLFGARCLVGLSAYGISIVVFSLLADLYDPACRGRATMVVTIGEVGGASAAFALGGALLAIPGLGGDSGKLAMLCLTAPLVLVTLLMGTAREPARAEVSISRPSARETCAELWRYRAAFAPLLTGKVMVGTAYGAVLIWAAPMLSRDFALAPDRIGSIMATGLLVSGISGPIVGGVLADICQRTGGPRRTMLALSGLGLLSALAGCFAASPGVATVGVLLVAFMTTISVVGVMEMTLTTVVIPNELRGLCLSVLVAAGLVIGVGLAPVAVSLLSGVLGGSAMIGRSLSVICVMTGVLGSGTFAFASRYVPQTV
jgi:MFS family permease